MTKPQAVYGRDLHGLGETLQLFRKRANMNVREAGDSIGISAATVSRIERGGVPNVRSYLAVDKWLGKQIDKLLAKEKL